MTDEQARKTAKGHIAAKRALIAVGTVAVTAAVAYGAYKYYDNNIDRTISAKQSMQTVHAGDAAERLKAGNPFFATYQQRDNTIYASKVFSHFKDTSNVTTFYTDEGIKVASRGTGRKIMQDLMSSNPELKEFVNKDRMLSKYSNNPKKLYDQFNKHLVLRGEDNDRAHKIFYDALRSKGYGAVIDVNDAKLEGWTYNPVIVFDNQIKHITSSTVATPEHLGPERLLKAAKFSYERKILNNPLSDPSIKIAAGVGAYSTVVTAAQSGSFVKAYKREHPKTKLTDFQIVSMYMQAQQASSKK